jgi:hypothetical protein
MDLYFNCQWGLEPQVWMSRDHNSDFTTVGQIKWRGQPVTVTLLHAGDCQTDAGVAKYPPDLFALLKSNLQKQVRRQKMSAVATANRMWELGQFELLRRLAIIAAEDVQISPETAVVVWLMAARSKGLLLGSDHRAWVLGYVTTLVQHPKCWRATNDDKAIYNGYLQPKQVLSSKHQQAQLLLGILLRTAYGGLAGDPPLVSRVVDWHLKTNSALLPMGVQRLDQPPNKVSVNPGAVDFHIWPSLPTQLVKLHPEFSEEDIKRMIWDFSSSINNRTVHPKLLPAWNKIRPDFKKLVQEYLSRILFRFPNL